MKKFILIALVVVTNVNAIELLSHKNTSTNVVKIARDQVESVWASETPACIKDGSKLLGVNKAFRSKGLKYADCSASDKAREKQRMLGYEVVKFDFTSLPDDLAKEVTSTK